MVCDRAAIVVEHELDLILDEDGQSQSLTVRGGGAGGRQRGGGCHHGGGDVAVVGHGHFGGGWYWLQERYEKLPKRVGETVFM